MCSIAHGSLIARQEREREPPRLPNASGLRRRLALQVSGVGRGRDSSPPSRALVGLHARSPAGDLVVRCLPVWEIKGTANEISGPLTVTATHTPWLRGSCPQHANVGAQPSLQPSALRVTSAHRSTVQGAIPTAQKPSVASRYYDGSPSSPYIIDKILNLRSRLFTDQIRREPSLASHFTLCSNHAIVRQRVKCARH